MLYTLLIWLISLNILSIRFFPLMNVGVYSFSGNEPKLCYCYELGGNFQAEAIANNGCCEHSCVCLLGKTYVYIYLEHRTNSGIVGTDSRFSLFTEPVLQSYCKHWIIKYWDIAPRGDTRLGSCEPHVKIFSSPDHCIALSYVYFCSKTLYLIYTVNSLTLNSLPTAL